MIGSDDSLDVDDERLPSLPIRAATIKLRGQRFPTERPPTDPFRTAQGLGVIPIGYAHTHPRTKELGRARARPSPRLPIDENLDLTLGPFPASNVSQGSGARRHALSHRGSGAPRRCPLRVALPAILPIGSHTGRDTRRQTPPWPLGARGLPGLSVNLWSRPPSPPRRLLKAHLREASPSRQQPDTQRVRTEQSNDAQGFIGSTTPRRLTEHHCKTLLDSGACRP
jgi:hypothetical protein